MKQYELISIAENLWGSQPMVKKTKVDGIYDVEASRHGGFLVDTNLHSKLKQYGDTIYNSNISAFEEDLEALKVLWLYPELINDEENVDRWLNTRMIQETYKGTEFLKEFPNRNIKKVKKFV